MTRRLLAVLLATAVACVLTVRADDPPAKPADPKTPAAAPAPDDKTIAEQRAIEEQQLREDFDKFKVAVLNLKQRLESSDKEEDKATAKTLEEVLKQIKTDDLDGTFAKAIAHLSDSKTYKNSIEAGALAKENKDLHDAMQKLIDLLQNSDEGKRLRAKIAENQKLLDQIKEILSKQERVIAQAERGQKSGKELSKPESGINKDIKGILDPNAKDKKPDFQKSEAKYDNKPGTDARGEAKKDTEGPKGAPKDDKSGENKDADKAGENKSGENKDGMKPGDGKEGDNKDGMKPSENKGGENKDGMKPGESKDGDKGGENKDGDKLGENKDNKGGENKDAKPGEGKDNNKPGTNANKDNKAGESKSGDQKDGKAGDGKQGPQQESKPGESKDGKAGDNKDGKPGESKDAKPGDGKPGEGKQGESKDGAKSAESKDGKGGDSKDGKTGEGKENSQAGQGKPGENKDGKGRDSKDSKAGEGKEASKSDPNGKPGDGKAGEGSKSGDMKPGDGKAGGDKPGEGKPGEPKPGDGQANAKPGEGKGNEAKPGATGSPSGKSGDGKSGKPGDGKTGKPGDSKESKPGDGKAGDGKAGDPKGGKPGDGKAGDGKPSEPKSGADSKGQSDGKGEAKQGDPKAGMNPDGKPSDSKGNPSQGQPSQGKGDGSSSDSPPPPPPPPGPKSEIPVRKQIEDGAKDSQETKEKFDENDNKGALPPANKTADDLNKAIKKLEEIINADRQEEIERILERLQARCARMLAMQIAVRDGTTALDAKFQDIRNMKGDERSAVQQSILLSDSEGEIVKEADKALALLEGDGSALAFAEMFNMVRKDMLTVEDRLSKEHTDTGAVTVGIEEEIIKNLGDMVEALKKQREINKNKQQGQPKPPGPPKPPGEDPLVDIIAQLRLLRSMQKGLNDRTELYHKEYPDSEQAPGVNEAKDAKEKSHYEMIQKEMKELADTESKISKILKDMLTGKTKTD